MTAPSTPGKWGSPDGNSPADNMEPTTMRIEIKALKIARSLSEETTAYTATIHVDGVATFAASNHGHGGCDMYHRLPTAKVTEAQVAAYLAVHEAPDGPYEADPAARGVWDMGHTCDLETFVGRFIAAQEAEAERKRVAKRFDGFMAKSIVEFRDGKIFTYKAAPTPANLASLRKSKPAIVLVNDADAATKTAALLAYCPDLRALPGSANSDELREGVYERLREGRQTVADAKWLLAENARAAKPCPDLHAAMTEVVAKGEAAYAHYCAERDAARAA